MAYLSNDTQEVVKTVKTGECNELRVSKISDKNGLKAIDIRNWYCTQKDLEMKPTYKGVRIKRDDLAEVLTSIIDNVDEDIKSDLLASGIDVLG